MAGQPDTSQQRSGAPRRLGTALYRQPESDGPFLFLPLEDHLTLLGEHGPWALVETSTGARGYVRTSDVDWKL